MHYCACVVAYVNLVSHYMKDSFNVTFLCNVIKQFYHEFFEIFLLEGC
jgi:hypothetical protein